MFVVLFFPAKMVLSPWSSALRKLLKPHSRARFQDFTVSNEASRRFVGNKKMDREVDGSRIEGEIHEQMD